MDATRTETTCVTPACVAPRHVDAPRDFFFFFFFFFFSPNEQRAGGGVRCQTFYFYFFSCSADHERDWPPCKVVFFGLATNALNVRNNNNNLQNIFVDIGQSGLFIWSIHGLVIKIISIITMKYYFWCVP